MSLGKYLTSRVFVAQMVAAIASIAILAFLFFHWITFITHHGDEITVPNLTNLTPEQIEDKLSDFDLDYEIIDTVDYNPDFKKLTIVQQEPTAGAKVKGGRTIYIKLNAATFTMVAIPDLIEKTYRQAVPTLKAIGLQEGEITYVPYIGKDMVLKIMMNGKEIKPGTKVLKSSKIDLVLGDGKVVFDSKEIDSLLQNETQVDTVNNAE
jgi:beta-lactam-binding protein with PASTA domain